MTDRPFDIRPDLAGLAPYAAPQPDAPIKLNTNECPWPPPDAFVSDLRAALGSVDLHRYPDRDARSIREGLATRFGWTPEGTWVANGSNELIQQLLLAFGGPERRALLFPPTYAMHTHIARVTGTQLVTRELPEPWQLEADSVAWGVSFEPPDITFICSPNNPTGNAAPTEVVRAALESGPGIVIVDEAYGEFSRETALGLLADHERLVILRSFSKSWRMAGARVGVLLAHPWVVDALQITRLPYHLSALTQTAVSVALTHQRMVQEGVSEIVVERERLAQELGHVPGVEVFPSDANFILFRTPVDGDRVWRGLVDLGILVRNFSGVIPRALRVTVGTSDDNAAFVEGLRKVLTDE